jgi:hypothetical protein
MMRGWIRVFGIAAACLPAVAAINVTCSSERGGREYCQADTGGGVELLHQISSAVCRKGYSWGQDGSGIWVDHGCKGTFAMVELGMLGSLLDQTKDYAKTRTIQCVSDGNKKRSFCQADTRGGVRMAKALNGSACTYGKSWGYDVGGVWVDRKCQAEFEIGGGASYNPPEVPGTGHIWGAGNGLKSFACSSDDGKRRTCEADTSSGAVLTKDLSGTACVRGETWGFDRHGVWVDRGCRGEFQTIQRETILK